MKLIENMSKEEFEQRIVENVKTLSRTTLDNATDDQIYEALAFTIRDIITDKWIATDEEYKKEEVKTVYYLSMEFLMGRFLGNAILNLTMDKDIKEVFDKLGIDLNKVEDQEADPGLGNGGLGRLAACFLDSLSNLELPAYGAGIRYHYGIFRQAIENGYQVEYPDNWLSNGDPWGIKRPAHTCEVRFCGNVTNYKDENGVWRYGLENYEAVKAIPYDYPVIGYNNNTINTLRLWDAEAVNTFDLQQFNEGNYDKATQERTLAKTLSEVLYPADEHMAGKELRLKQQYFFVSATVQTVIKKHMEKYNDIKLLPEKVAFQLNDTHPSITVAELLRILLDEFDLTWEESYEITRHTCAYTNHTIMSEALEKWPIELFSRVLPRHYMIIEELNKRFCQDLIDMYGNDSEKLRRMAIVADGQVRMAHLAMVGSFSINGVAALHTEILKNQELREFYEIYPEKFNNKTNGITQRRWLGHCNPGLSDLVTEKIGNDWLKDLSSIKDLEKYADDKEFQKRFMEIKKANKIKVAEYVKANMGIEIDPNSIFDIQVKRLHEYKRQLMNILHVLYLYNQIKANPNVKMTPRTFFFAAKSAAGYKRAKLIIKLINEIANKVNNDPVVDGRLKVVFIPNYRVTLAELLIPSADLSEQISTASKEASGTGNMKFMLNGALTIGTLDGANVEILEEVGEENIFIFGMKSEEVIELNQKGGYQPWDIYNSDADIRLVLTQLINGTLVHQDDPLFRELYDALLNGYGGSRADEYYILKDLKAYAKAHEDAMALYNDESAWAKAAILNVASSGKFSSDRTIQEYANEIWKLKPTPIKM